MLDIIVIGAGPAGLSCAIEAKNAGLSAILLDKGNVADSLRRFPTNVTWFSTPELLEIGNIPFVISTVRPSRTDVVRYYQKVAQHYDLDVRGFDAVVDVRRTTGYFTVVTANGMKYEARNIVIATGYFDHPNRLGVPGEDLLHVSHYYTEPYQFFGSDVVVIGGRNSAVEASLELFRNGARVTLVHRGSKLSEGVKYWVLPDIENRIKSGEVTAMFEATVSEIGPRSVLVQRKGDEVEVKADFVFVLIGFRPDVEHLRAYGIELNPETLAPCHDPETMETNVKGLFVAGSIAAGKNNNKIFVENGRLHGRSIISTILSRSD